MGNIQSMRVILVLSILMLVSAIGILLSVDSARAGNIPIASRTEQENQIINTYKTVSPAVVFIATETLTVDPQDLFPEVQAREGSGTGFIIDAKKGLVLTNLHVIRGAHRVQIILSDGDPHEAVLVGYDQEYDVAVLRITSPPGNLVALEFTDSSRIEVGQNVLAIGNPFGLNRTLTQGIVSSLDRAVKAPAGRIMKGLIQTDAAINPGNSGGPLLDTDGRVMGINTAILSQSGDSAGIGFAIPINAIRRVLPELIATGKVLRPKIGWLLIDTSQGPFIRRISRDGPAAEAGVQPVERMVDSVFIQGFVRDFARADMIVKVDGIRVYSVDEIEEIVSQSDPNKPIRFTLKRGGARGTEREVEIKAILG